MSDDKRLARVPKPGPTQAPPWPSMEVMLVELLELAGHVHLHHGTLLDSEPYEASISVRGSYLAFRGKTATGAIRRLWLAVKRLQGGPTP